MCKIVSRGLLVFVIFSLNRATGPKVLVCSNRANTYLDNGVVLHELNQNS